MQCKANGHYKEVDCVCARGTAAQNTISGNVLVYVCEIEEPKISDVATMRCESSVHFPQKYLRTILNCNINEHPFSSVDSRSVSVARCCAAVFPPFVSLIAGCRCNIYFILLAFYFFYHHLFAPQYFPSCRVSSCRLNRLFPHFAQHHQIVVVHFFTVSLLVLVVSCVR